MMKSAIAEFSNRVQAVPTMPFANGETRPERPAETAVRFRTCKSWPGAEYYLALPETVSESTPVLVAAHGISRNAREHAQTFAKHCNTLGWAVVAPLFTPSRFPSYQRLGFSRKHNHPRPDLALNAILDEVTDRTGARTGRVYMFGFSGGGQFVHRYAMIHPDRVIAAALGAPGWFTFPDRGAPFPRGLHIDAGKADFQLEWRRALRVPTAVFVGAQDLGRDSALNTAQKIDDQQGRTRPERGRRWIAAMRQAARLDGLETRYEFCELAGCGHSFSDCISTGQLESRVLEFLIRAGIPTALPSARNGRRAGYCQLPG